MAIQIRRGDYEDFDESSMVEGELAVTLDTDQMFYKGGSVCEIQTKLTFDDEPTSDSTNPVTSDGIYTALNSAETEISTNTTAIGTLTDLTTDTQTDLVSAINEVDANTDTNTTNIATNTSEISEIKADLTSMSRVVSDSRYEYVSIDPQWTAGEYVNTSGSIVSGSSYHCTEKIRLTRGQCICVESVKGASSVSLVALFDTSGEFLEYVIKGNGSGTERNFSYQNRYSYDVDVIISSNSAITTSISITNPMIINDADAYNAVVSGIPMYAYVSCYFTSSAEYNTISTLTGNSVTTPIFLKKGKRIVIETTATTSVAQLMISDKYGAVSSVIAMNTGESLITNYAPEEDTYVIVGGNLTSETPTIIVVDDVANPLQNNFNLRMPTITFVFDDGTTGDANAVTVFKNHGKRCSFALISSILSDIRYADYLQYQAEGFEILSHSTDGRTMNGYSAADITDESTAIECMTDSKSALVNAGFDIHGWVTPSGRLNPSWVDDVKLYYDYGFVLANMTAYTDSETQTPYFTSDISAFATFRVSLQNTTLAMCESAVDLAIANSAMLVFYGHAVNETSDDNLTIDFLDELLDYIDSLDDSVQVLPCNSAMKYFFKTTHEEAIS